MLTVLAVVCTLYGMIMGYVFHLWQRREHDAAMEAEIAVLREASRRLTALHDRLQDRVTQLQWEKAHIWQMVAEDGDAPTPTH